jgi:formylglycine-generating enzyme required for sulfatase activity
VTETTVEHFAECVTKGACVEPDRGGACNWGVSARRRHPINCVSQPEASAYCRFVGGRLPTIAEAEWFARGGSTASAYPWGDVPPLGQLCWSGEAPRRETCAVGSFPGGTSKEGIVDLIGNVREWTSSPSDGGVHRFRVGGGSFGDTDPRAVAWTTHWDDLEDVRSPQAGFRCVTTPQK